MKIKIHTKQASGKCSAKSSEIKRFEKNNDDFRKSERKAGQEIPEVKHTKSSRPRRAFIIEWKYTEEKLIKSQQKQMQKDQENIALKKARFTLHCELEII